MRARAGVAVALVLVSLVLAQPAVAQGTVPVLVDADGPERLAAAPGGTVVLNYTLYNLNAATDVFVNLQASGFGGWEVEFDANRFFLQPREQRVVAVNFTAEEGAAGMVRGTLEFTLVNGESGATDVREREVEVSVQSEPLVLGLFANPLPPPLDNEWGAFALNLAVWGVLGALAFLLNGRIVNLLTRRAPERVSAAIRGKLRIPIFLFVFLLGLERSFSVLPPFPFTDFVRKVLAVLTFGVIGVYLLYRALDSGLYYVSEEIAPRTTTKIDDVVVPILRKFGLGFLVIIGAGAVMKEIGWDPTVLFAGAGIAGLALAFAAQETISNLFSGIFLLLDRPFKEGDDIMLQSGEVCRVEKVGLRSTRLYFYRDHIVFAVPNRDIANSRIASLNYPDRKWKMNVDVGVAYGTDVEAVKEILLTAAQEHPRVSKHEDELPIARFTAFGDNALLFMLRVTVLDLTERFQVAAELRERVLREFNRRGIEIPFPQRTVWMRETQKAKDEAKALKAAGAEGADA